MKSIDLKFINFIRMKTKQLRELSQKKIVFVMTGRTEY